MVRLPVAVAAAPGAVWVMKATSHEGRRDMTWEIAMMGAVRNRSGDSLH
jgi:hypothetical protein